MPARRPHARTPSRAAVVVRAAVLASLLAACGAQASDEDARALYVFGTPHRWNGTVPWSYNDTGRNASLDPAEVVARITGAARQWTDACAVTIQRGADTDVAPQSMDGAVPSPGIDVIGWGDLAQGPAGDPSAAAITWTYSAADDGLSGFDMTLSAAGVETYDQLTRVVLHEWGHAIGLAHSNVPGTVMAGPASIANPGVPPTGYTSLTALTDDDRHGCLCLYGAGPATQGQGYLCGLPPVLAMDATPLGSSSAPRNVTLTNASPAHALTVTGVTTGSDELLRSGAGCGAGTTLGPGASCSFNLVFRPFGASGRRDTAWLRIDTSNGVGSYAVPVTAYAGDSTQLPLASLSPRTLAFGFVDLGTTSPVRVATLSNVGGGILTVNDITASGPGAGDYQRSGDCRPGTTLAAQRSCTLAAVFAPSAIGTRAATLTLSTSRGALILDLAGTAQLPTDGTGPVVEYYNAGLDHYFITANAGEMAVLDQGQLAGWTRTGYGFRAFTSANALASPVCRYYIPPPLGNSHFYSVLPEECASIPQQFPMFELESTRVMYMAIPDVGTGACPQGMVPVYRLWNARPDSNHRYTTDAALRDAMKARGYIAEGFGAEAVAMCAPR